MREIKERRKRFLVFLLTFLVSLYLLPINGLAAGANLGSIYEGTYNPDACKGMHLKPADTIAWGTGGCIGNIDYKVKYVVGDTTYIDNIITTNFSLSGGTETYTVLSLQNASGGADSRSVDYWELTSIKEDDATYPQYVAEITLVAHFPNAVKSSDSGETHIHNYEWGVTKEPTPEEDGEEAYMCSCGSILHTVPISGTGAFIKQVIKDIQNAPLGGTVEVKTDKWLCFNKAVCDAYALRPDVTLKISYREEGYKGTRLTTVVPAGTDLGSYLNEDGYIGFLYLRTLFTTTIDQ